MIILSSNINGTESRVQVARDLIKNSGSDGGNMFYKEDFDNFKFIVKNDVLEL